MPDPAAVKACIVEIFYAEPMVREQHSLPVVLGSFIEIEPTYPTVVKISVSVPGVADA